MNVRLRDQVDYPVWIGQSRDEAAPFAQQYYRGMLPARMAGGESRATLDVAGQPLDPTDAQAVDRLAGLTGPVEVCGLGTPTVFRLPGLHLAPPLIDLIEAIGAAGGEVYLETDDDYLSLPYYEFLKQDVEQRFGQGHAALVRMELERKAFQQERTIHEVYRRVLGVVAGVIVSTEVLAATVRPYNANVLVLPNVVDPADLPSPQRPNDDVIRVGFAGNYRKYIEDLPEVLGHLIDVARRPNVQLHLFGWVPPCYPPWHIEGVPVTFHAHTDDFFAYHWKLGWLDVAIAPLEATAFNRARSHAKWLEHSLHATAMVVADLEPYACVEHGRTGLKARCADDWRDGIEQLVTDGALRRAIGEAARAEVLRAHTVEAGAALYAWLLVLNQLPLSLNSRHLIKQKVPHWVASPT